MRILPISFILMFAIAACQPTENEFQLIDYHVHLKGDLTLDKAIAHSEVAGIKYGVAVNCGIGFPVMSDSAALAWLNEMKGSPFMLAMQAEGREWVDIFSKEVVDQFDYVFTDAMTYTDENGKRVRLWMKDEVSVPDAEVFMDGLVDRIVIILNTEPIDIYVNPSFLPEVISDQYDALWTRERMDRVITALSANGIALEINNRYRIPSEKFIKRAKKAGVKFAFGTNNTDSHMGDLDYCLEMKEKCELEEDDMFWIDKKFNVLVWNIWHGGNDASLPSDGRPSVVEVIKTAAADIVLMIETYGSAPYIAEQTGMNYHLISDNLCIFSHDPIGQTIDFKDDISTFNFGGAEVMIEAGYPIWFFDTWLHYLPDTRLVPTNASEAEILAWENEGTRDDEVMAISKVLAPFIEKADEVPIILGGDLNSHSHLDWTAATKDMYHHGGAVVDWTISSTLAQAGFKDAFRTIYPDPVEMPGTSWISAWENDQQVFNRVDRIDYCYYQGSSIKVLAAESHICPPGDTLEFRSQKIMYPSDHGFVLIKMSVN